jgi:hypothetical protein
MLYRQLGEDRGESRAANVSDRFIVAAVVSAAERKAFGTNASTTFSDPCNLHSDEYADRRPAHGKNRQPV